MFNNAFTCQSLDLDGEDLGFGFAFFDQGANRCGCPQANERGEIASASVAPPTPVAFEGDP